MRKKFPKLVKSNLLQQTVKHKTVYDSFNKFSPFFVSKVSKKSDYLNS